jgi:acyl-coenzyme A thioesterase 13
MNSSAKSPPGSPSSPVTPDDLFSIDHSGARGLIGYRSYVAGDGIAACVLRLGPQHLNRLGVLHGGLVAMLLDTAAGLAVRNFSRDKESPTVTVSMTVNYISVAKSDEVTATARITGGGRSLKFAEAELRDQDGTLLATASGAYKLLEKRRKAGES